MAILTITGVRQLGRMVRNMISKSDTPNALSAVTNSISFVAIAMERVRRAKVGMLVNATAKIATEGPGPRIETMPMARKMPGKAKMVSQTRMMIESAIPPIYPAIKPVVTPTTAANETANSPISREMPEP